jgi:hypothetical protein
MENQREQTMNQIDPKLREAVEHVEKAQKIMTELGHTKYTIRGMVSKQMLYDSEQEVAVLLGKLAAAEDALRELACFMSCGGYNDVGLVEFDPAHYAKKIKEAIINDAQTILKSKSDTMKPVYIEINERGRYYYSDASMKTRHRTDGPAIEYASGTKEWYVNGVRHRTDGPAIEYASGTKGWYVNGLRHRTDGPAYEWANGRKEWFLNGKFLTETDATSPSLVLTLDEIAAKFGVNVKNLKISK